MRCLLYFFGLLLVSVNAVCNCIQCDLSSHPIGSQTWCRCCTNVVSTTCRDNCTESVFTYGGCVSSNYESLCLNTPAPTPHPTGYYPPTPLPPTVQWTPPIVVRACNCVGCHQEGLSYGGRQWCRCCAQTFKPLCNDPNTTADENCQRSRFTVEGCLYANYTDNCL